MSRAAADAVSTFLTGQPADEDKSASTRSRPVDGAAAVNAVTLLLEQAAKVADAEGGQTLSGQIQELIDSRS